MVEPSWCTGVGFTGSQIASATDRRAEAARNGVIMKRSLLASAAAAIFVGTSALGIGAAAADPGLTITSGGQPLVNGGTPVIGGAVEFDATSCSTSGGDPGYVGLFISSAGDPALGVSSAQAEAQANSDGSMTATLQATEPNNTETINGYVRWYCAQAPVQSLSDRNVLYSGSLLTFTIAPVADRQAPMTVRSTGRSTKRPATPPVRSTKANQLKATITRGNKPLATTGSNSVLSVSVDSDSLPLVDTVDLPGPLAATYKYKTDTQFDGSAVVSRIYAGVIGGPGPGMKPFNDLVKAGAPATSIATALYNTPQAQARFASLSDQAFVNTAFKLVLGRSPSDAENTKFLGKLTSGQSRSLTLWQVGALNDATRGNAAYVKAALAVAGRNSGRPAEWAKYVAELDSGQYTKVQVVEQVMLDHR